MLFDLEVDSADPASGEIVQRGSNHAHQEAHGGVDNGQHDHEGHSQSSHQSHWRSFDAGLVGQKQGITKANAMIGIAKRLITP